MFSLFNLLIKTGATKKGGRQNYVYANLRAINTALKKEEKFLQAELTFLNYIIELLLLLLH